LANLDWPLILLAMLGAMSANLVLVLLLVDCVTGAMIREPAKNDVSCALAGSSEDQCGQNAVLGRKWLIAGVRNEQGTVGTECSQHRCTMCFNVASLPLVLCSHLVKLPVTWWRSSGLRADL